MTVLASWRRRLASAIERGDPRLGLGVGLAISLLAAWAFVARVPVARRAEDAVLDTAFQVRPPIREAPEILMVDLNDQALQQLKWPILRSQYARVALALDRLGARDIVFDVEFKSTAVRPHEYDPRTGDYVLSDDDRELRAALGISGKVMLAYHFGIDDGLSPALRARFPAILSSLRENFALSNPDLGRRAGADPALLERERYDVDKEAALALTAELLEQNPRLTFREVRERFLPGEAERDHPEKLKVLQYAYWVNRGIALLSEKGPRVVAAGRPAGSSEVHDVVPPFYPLLERARAAAPVNAPYDGDGVLRRPWACLWYRGRPYPYLGLAAALDGRVSGEAGRLEPGAFRIGGPGGPALPLDAEGRLLINWSGNRLRRRGGAEHPFTHLAFHELLGFYEERYDLMDRNFRDAIAKKTEESGEPYHAEYLGLSDRLRAAYRGVQEVSGDDVRAIEARMDAHRKEILADIEGDVATLEKVIPTLPSPRAREQSTKALQRLREDRTGLRLAYDREEKLAPLVKGKICWVGSASTASGDLHSTPLGPTTPGVDALAHVCNMALTGQAIRQAPPALVFGYLLLVGLLVSAGVSHWRTTWAALATIALVAAALGLYYALFAWGSILLSGAGPVGTAVFAFAGVTAFKELVTERSRRKLEKELEKNTSPELVEILMEHPELLRRPRKMTGTFFFSDIKSFTSISEKMKADVLFPFVNRYLDRATQSLKKHRAYLDKYIGDGIMALFGIPVASDDHARNACRAALENQALLVPLNEEFEREGLPRIKARIGINSGEASAGYVGATDRSDYTVLGDAVNLASRLEAANKEYDTSIMVSEFTYRLVAGEFVFRELDRIRVVGKRDAVGIYELAAAAGAPPPFGPGFLEAYAAALALFRARRWDDAIGAFGKALALRPGDRPCELYVGRARRFLAVPPPPDWEAVFDLSSK